MAMIWLLSLVYLPVEWGSIIGICAVTTAGSQHKTGQLYLLLFALALTIGSTVQTGGLSVLALIGSYLLSNWTSEKEFHVSFPAFILAFIMAYGTYFFVASSVLMG